jgi:hypothetical protein
MARSITYTTTIAPYSVEAKSPAPRSQVGIVSWGLYVNFNLLGILDLKSHIFKLHVLVFPIIFSNLHNVDPRDPMLSLLEVVFVYEFSQATQGWVIHTLKN